MKKININALISIFNILAAVCILGSLVSATPVLLDSKTLPATLMLVGVVTLTVAIGSMKGFRFRCLDEGEKAPKAHSPIAVGGHLASILAIEDCKSKGPVAFVKMGDGQYEWIDRKGRSFLVDEETLTFLKADTKSFVYKNDKGETIHILLPKCMVLQKFIIKRGRRGLFRFGFIFDKSHEARGSVFGLGSSNLRWMCPCLITMGALYSAVKLYASRVYPIDDNVIQPLMRAMIIAGAEDVVTTQDEIKNEVIHAKA